jgi:hypothetical protein
MAGQLWPEIPVGTMVALPLLKFSVESWKDISCKGWEVYF